MNRWLSTGLAAAAALILAGCSKSASDPILASVGERKITLSAYKQAWQNLPDSDKPSVDTPEARRSFLDDLINKDLMELEAIHRQPELDEGQRRRLHRYAEGQLMTLLTEAEINKKISVAPAEVEEVWNRMDREYHARHIVVPTEAEARTILAELRGGADFATLARTKSKDPESGPRGGDLGWVQAGMLVESFDKTLYTLKAGELGGPVQSRFGWHVIMAEEIRPAERPALDTVRDRIDLNLLQQRSLARQVAFQAELREKAKPENQLPTIQLLDQKYYFELPASMANDQYAMLNAQREVPAFSNEELALPVIKFADRPALTVKDFNEALTWMPPGVWPTGKGLDEMETVLGQLLRAKLYRDRAIELGIDKSAEYVRLVKRKEAEMRVNSLYYNGIVNKIVLTEAQKREFFDKHRDSYKVVERHQLSRVESADSSVAALAARTWRSGKDFSDLESMVKGLDPNATCVELSFEIARGQETPLDDLIYEGNAKPGDIIGPVFLDAIQVEGGQTISPRWVVARIVEVKPERLMTYEEAQQYVGEHAKTAASEEALKAVLDEARGRFPIKIEEAALNALTAEKIQEGAAAKTAS